MKTNWLVKIINAIADLITRTKGLDDIHDDVDSVKTAQAKQILPKDQWCDPEDAIPSLAFSDVAADKDFADVTFPAGFLPSGAVVDAIYLMVYWGKKVDTSGAPNAINGVGKAIRVMKSGGAWGTDDMVGITMGDNTLATAANAPEGGLIIIGTVDVKGEVDDVDNETYNIRSEQTNRNDAIVVDGASLTLYDVYTGLRVLYHV